MLLALLSSRVNARLAFFIIYHSWLKKKEKQDNPASEELSCFVSIIRFFRLISHSDGQACLYRQL